MFGVEQHNASHTISPQVLPRAASARLFPRSLWLACGLTHAVLRRRALLTRDAYDRFLPSAASISSTRASFVLGEVAPRANGIVSVPPVPPVLKGVASPSDERSSTQRFHAA
jgi:hypothetical protein